MSKSPESIRPIIKSTGTKSWEELETQSRSTPTAIQLEAEIALRDLGAGTAHTDSKIRLFGTTGEPRITFYRDTAGWCPYCQKVWILLEEKNIPYKVEKINMVYI